MHSKGSGVKHYHITVFALSQTPHLSTEKVKRDDLLQSISDITLAQGTFKFHVDRITITNVSLLDRRISL